MKALCHAVDFISPQSTTATGWQGSSSALVLTSCACMTTSMPSTTCQCAQDAETLNVRLCLSVRLYLVVAQAKAQSYLSKNDMESVEVA